jgi:hypothetical protein
MALLSGLFVTSNIEWKNYLSRKGAAKFDRCHFDPFGQAQGKLQEKAFLRALALLG